MMNSSKKGVTGKYFIVFVVRSHSVILWGHQRVTKKASRFYLRGKKISMQKPDIKSGPGSKSFLLLFNILKVVLFVLVWPMVLQVRTELKLIQA